MSELRRIYLVFGAQMAAAYLLLAIVFTVLICKIFHLIKIGDPALIGDLQKRKGILKVLSFVFLFTYLFRVVLLCVLGKWHNVIPSLFVRYELYLTISLVSDAPALFIVYIKHY